MPKQKHWSRLFIATLLMALSSIAPAIAATNANASDIQSVAQSYSTAKALQQGLIVKLDAKSKGSVSAVGYKDSSKTFGVVVQAAAAPVTLSSGQGQQAYVVTSGRYATLVSNQNGAIKAGDYVALSAIDGIGMHADGFQPTVLGRAASSFDGKSNIVSTTDLKTADGKTIKAAIGSVVVDISVAANPLKTNGENGVPNFVQKLAKTVVGKPITATQLYGSLAIFITGIIVVASLLYGGIQTGMTAIGRNPLARKSIMRNLIQVLATGVMIFIGCLIAVYLVLKI